MYAYISYDPKWCEVKRNIKMKKDLRNPDPYWQYGSEFRARIPTLFSLAQNNLPNENGEQEPIDLGFATKC